MIHVQKVYNKQLNHIKDIIIGRFMTFLIVNKMKK